MTEQTKTISIAAAAITIMGAALGFLLFGASIPKTHGETYAPVIAMLDDGTVKHYPDGIIPQADLEHIAPYRMADQFAGDLDHSREQYYVTRGVNDRVANIYARNAYLAIKGVCMTAKLLGRQNLPASAKSIRCDTFTDAELQP